MEMIQEYWGLVQPHWPALMFLVAITVVAQTLKTRVLTKQLASKSRTVFWLRRVFPLILLGLGVVMGLVWPGETSPGVSATGHKCLYFAGCSALSIVGFTVFKQFIKKKYDVDIGVPELKQ